MHLRKDPEVTVHLCTDAIVIFHHFFSKTGWKTIVNVQFCLKTLAAILFHDCNKVYSGKTHENSPKFGYVVLICDAIFPAKPITSPDYKQGGICIATTPRLTAKPSNRRRDDRRFMLCKTNIAALLQWKWPQIILRSRKLAAMFQKSWTVHVELAPRHEFRSISTNYGTQAGW